MLRGLGGSAGVAGDLLHGEAHLVHGGGHHVGHFLLLAGAGRGVVHHLGHLADHLVQALAGVQHFADQAALAFQEAVETTGEVAQLVRAAFVQAAGEVAATAADFHQCRSDLADRPHQPASQ
ncbi:hypothetical protein D9M69_471750 [compost metagenome]